jgi:hypothetical protein
VLAVSDPLSVANLATELNHSPRRAAMLLVAGTLAPQFSVGRRLLDRNPRDDAGRPAGGAEVLITSSSPSAIVPASVVVAAGQMSATFTITTRQDPAFASATIGGSDNGGFDASAQLTVRPAGTAQGVTSLSLNPTSVVGPASAAGTVTTRYASSTQPVTVALASNVHAEGERLRDRECAVSSRGPEAGGPRAHDAPARSGESRAALARLYPARQERRRVTYA